MGYEFSAEDRVYVRMDGRNESLLYSVYRDDAPVSEGEINQGASVFQVHGLFGAIASAEAELIMGQPPVPAELPQ